MKISYFSTCFLHTLALLALQSFAYALPPLEKLISEVKSCQDSAVLLRGVSIAPLMTWSAKTEFGKTFVVMRPDQTYPQKFFLVMGELAFAATIDQATPPETFQYEVALPNWTTPVYANFDNLGGGFLSSHLSLKPIDTLQLVKANAVPIAKEDFVDELSRGLIQALEETMSNTREQMKLFGEAQKTVKDLPSDPKFQGVPQPKESFGNLFAALSPVKELPKLDVCKSVEDEHFQSALKKAMTELDSFRTKESD